MPIVENTLIRFGLNGIDLKDVLFLTGTGISAPDPTAFFLGRELHRTVLENFTKLSQAEISTVLANVPFEKSCEAINAAFQGHSLSTFVNVFWNMISELFIWRENEAWTQPNELHAYFREHVRQGGKHITANLDQFIEKEELFHSVRTTKGFESGIPYHEDEGLLYKFHGDFTRDSEGGQGFVIGAIGNGFTNAVQTVWDRLLAKAKLVVVCGYGGVDCYDVTPYFRSKAPGAFDGCILWTSYDDAPLSQITTTGSADIDIIVSRFRQAAVLKGRSGDVLNALPLALPRIYSMTRTGLVSRQYTECVAKTVAQYSAHSSDFENFKQISGTAILNLPHGP